MHCDVDLWHIDLALTTPPSASELALLSPEEAARMGRLRDAASARRFARTRIALRHLLSSRLGEPASRIAIALDTGGKPFFAQAPECRFNVSHAGDRALIAMSASADVGVDLEHQDALGDLARLREQVCTRAERAWLDAHPARARDALHALWVRKEAVLKCVGVGLATAPSGLDLSATMDGDSGVVGLGQARQVVRWQQLPIEDGFVAAVAVSAGAEIATLVITTRR